MLILNAVNHRGMFAFTTGETPMTEGPDPNNGKFINITNQWLNSPVQRISTREAEDTVAEAEIIHEITVGKPIAGNPDHHFAINSLITKHFTVQIDRNENYYIYPLLETFISPSADRKYQEQKLSPQKLSKIPNSAVIVVKLDDHNRLYVEIDREKKIISSYTENYYGIKSDKITYHFQNELERALSSQLSHAERYKRNISLPVSILRTGDGEIPAIKDITVLKIGRANNNINDVVIENASVSREHVTIHYDGNGYNIKNTSSNGTEIYGFPKLEQKGAEQYVSEQVVLVTIGGIPFKLDHGKVIVFKGDTAIAKTSFRKEDSAIKEPLRISNGKAIIKDHNRVVIAPSPKVEQNFTLTDGQLKSNDNITECRILYIPDTKFSQGNPHMQVRFNPKSNDWSLITQDGEMIVSSKLESYPTGISLQNSVDNFLSISNGNQSIMLCPEDGQINTVGPF